MAEGVGFGGLLILFDYFRCSVKPWPVLCRCFVWSFDASVKPFGLFDLSNEFDSHTVRQTHG